VSAAAAAALGAPAQPVSPEPVSPEPVPPEPVPPEPVPPRLELSATVLDFGRLPHNSKPPQRRVRLGNAGSGALNARASTQANWLELRQVSDELLVGMTTTAAGEHEDIITVDSDGGAATIRVTATVDPLPAPAPASSPAPQPPGAAVDQTPTADQTTTSGIQQPPAWPPPAPEHATRGRPRPRQDGPSELDSGPRGFYQGDKLATWLQRVGAALIDLLPTAPALILFIVGVGIYNTGYNYSDQSQMDIGNTLQVIGVLIALPIIAYNRWRLQGRTGQSWGKRALHLKLVRMTDKQSVGSRAAFGRDVAHIVDILPCCGGFLLPIWTVQRQTLADKVMKTVVISQGKTRSSIS
jgi:uncharacterized RDD family membrane protein YckC